MDYKYFGIKTVKKFLVFILAISFASCVAQDFPSVSAEEAYKMKMEKDSVIFVDVRTEEEFNGYLGHITNAILIPLDKLEEDFTKLENFRDFEVIVYCRSGTVAREQHVF